MMQENWKLTVVGIGGIGGLLSGPLVRQYGEHITLVARGKRGETLRQKGVVLRSCANYPGLDGSWYRTAVRTAAENERLLQILSEVFS